jgi:NADH-quinone oxidoreductase subunit H
MVVTNIAKFLIIPGAFFIIYTSIVLAWFVRFITARMENRVGPPFNQPAFDLAKLLAKERIYPEGSVKWILHYMPMFQVSVALMMAFFIPIWSKEGLISFEGDLYFFLFLLAMHGSTAFMVGWSSRNPYAISGAGRAVMTEISLEIPLAISLAGMAIMTGSMRISVITDRVWTAMFPDALNPSIEWLFVIPYILMLVTVFYSSLGALELSPFSAAHAETEIVGGWNTELTGSDLAFTKFADFVNLFNLSAIIACLFLGGPIVIDSSLDNPWGSILIKLIAIVTFAVKLFIIVFVVAFVRTLSSRLRIDQIARALWSYFFPISMLSVFLVISIIQIGGM